MDRGRGGGGGECVQTRKPRRLVAVMFDACASHVLAEADLEDQRSRPVCGEVQAE